MAKNIRTLLSSIGHLNENSSLIAAKDWIIAPIGVTLIRFGVSPTILNLVGLIIGLLSAVVIGAGYLKWGFICLLAAGVADLLDGFVARKLGISSILGVFIDSVFDRYVDTAVLLGLAWYFMKLDKPVNVLLMFVAVVGTVVTSYSRARAESLSLSSRYVGFMNRPERIVLVLIGLLFPASLSAISWILAVMSNFTAVHRIVFYVRDAQSRAQVEMHKKD